MVRSAAKNFQDVADRHLARRLRGHCGRDGERRRTLSLATKWRLAQKAFATTAAYDSAIASTLERVRRNGDGEVRAAGRTVSRRRCGCASTRRSICATARIRTRRPRCIPTARRGVAERQAAPGQGTQLQQHRRSAGRVGPGAGIRRDRLRHHQAHQSLRHGRRGRWPRRTSVRWSAIRCRRSAA